MKGHTERRKRRELWTLHEVGNDAVDKVAGRVSAAVVAEVRQWDKQVAEWASVRAVLTAGRLATSGGVGGGGGASGVCGSAGDGPDGERHRAAVAEARRHLGGGGKRGWLA